MMTLLDLLTQALPPGTEVVAGADRQATEITWAANLRSRAPGFEGLKGGEIALVNVINMRQLDDRLTIARLIDQVAGANVAAMAVVGILDRDAIAAANRHGIVLLSLPEDTSTREMEVRITRLIVERRTELQQVTQNLYHRFLEQVIGGHGVEGIAALLAETTRHYAVVQNAAGESLVIRRPPGPLDQSGTLAQALLAQMDDDLRILVALAGPASDPPVVQLPLSGMRWERLVAPIGDSGRREGYLSLAGPAGELFAQDRLALARAAAAAAIESSRDRAPARDTDRQMAELLDDLVSGSYPSENVLTARAERIGLDLAGELTVLVFRSREADGQPASKAIDRVLRREFARRSFPLAIRADLGGVMALLPAASPLAATRALIQTVRAEAVGTGGHLAVGIGRPVTGPLRLREELSIVQRTIDHAIKTRGADAEVSLAEMGVDELLLAIGPSPLFEEFERTWLGRLRAYDEKNHTQLLQTLEAYFESHNSPTEAADRLHLHRNTLLYRLQRIREICGRDPDEASTGLALHLALRINKVFGLLDGSGKR